MPPKVYTKMPGTPRFKIMVREKEWKYIYFANGAVEQLFNVQDDPNEVRTRIADAPDVAQRLREVAIEACKNTNVDRALNSQGFVSFPYGPRPLQRILQFDQSRGITGFPKTPAEVTRGMLA